MADVDSELERIRETMRHGEAGYAAALAEIMRRLERVEAAVRGLREGDEDEDEDVGRTA